MKLTQAYMHVVELQTVEDSHTVTVYNVKYVMKLREWQVYTWQEGP